MIVSVGGHGIRAEDDVAAALQGSRPGATITLQVLRDGARATLRVKLGERPLDARAG